VIDYDESIKRLQWLVKTSRYVPVEDWKEYMQIAITVLHQYRTGLVDIGDYDSVEGDIALETLRLSDESFKFICGHRRQS